MISHPPNKQKPHVPMLIKASLKNHSPQEIYEFIFRHIGQLGIKIKKKQAVIGFQNQDYYDKLLREHKTVMLHGKKLQFIPIPKSDENQIQSQQEEIIEIKKPDPQGIDSKYVVPEFKAKNTLQSIANRYRHDMHKKVEDLFNSTVSTTRRRVQQFRLEIKDQAPRHREVVSLQALLQNRLKTVETKYETDLNKLNQSIQQFSMKANNIDVEPTFTFEENWQFPKISERNIRFQQCAFYKNPDHSHASKRLCAINGNQFAVTMSSNKSQGKVKLFDVAKSDAKKTIIADPGVYGICRIRNYLIVGGTDSTIKYIDLEDSEVPVNTTRKLMNNPKIAIFDIKILKHSEEKPQILAISIDNTVRRFQISIDDMGHGLKDLSFEEKQAINVGQCCTFQIVNPNVIIYGKDQILKKYQMQKKITRDIKINSKPLKIKKFNSNLFAVASQGVVELADMRTQSVVQKFPFMPKQLRSLEVVGQHSFMYGGLCQIGLLDDRRPTVLPWKSQAHHKDIVYDILKLHNIVVSCDKRGGIYGWRLAEQNATEPITVELS